MRLLDLFARAPRPDGSAPALERWLAAQGLDLQTAPVADLLAAGLDFYANQRFTGVEPEDADGDMLLFQYGCYDWGDGEHFNLKLTRQFIAARGDNPVSQLHLAFLFHPDGGLRGLGAYEAWCPTRTTLPGFRAEVLASPAVLLVGARGARRREVSWSRV